LKVFSDLPKPWRSSTVVREPSFKVFIDFLMTAVESAARLVYVGEELAWVVLV
jgi:hypothetical protein